MDRLLELFDKLKLERAESGAIDGNTVEEILVALRSKRGERVFLIVDLKFQAIGVILVDRFSWIVCKFISIKYNRLLSKYQSSAL